jgi:hypothetical protein
MRLGGYLGYAAAGEQALGGVLQGLGDQGYSNAVDAFASAAPGIALSIGARYAKYANPSYIQRKINSFVDTADTLGGTGYDMLASRLDLDASQAGCQ